jgi:hypothetical protein
MPLAARPLLASLAVSLAAAALFAGPAAAEAPDAPATAIRRGADEAPDNVVLANLFVMPFGVYNVEYERALGDRWSVTAGLTGFYANGTPFDASIRSRGLGGNLGARYYVTGAAPQGLFAAAFLRAFYVSLEAEGGMEEGPTAGGGAMVGYAHLFWKRLHVSAAAGAHVIWGDAAGTHLMPTGRAIDPELRLALGVAF